MITDHKGLVSLRTGRQENRRIYGWSLKLAEFDFEMRYRKGELNVVADDLSHCHSEDSGVTTRLLKMVGGEMWASPHEVMKKKEEDKETLN